MVWWQKALKREESAQNDQPRAEGSQEREESAPNDGPMQNPYQQPSRRAGGSLQREGPVDQWEQQRSSSGSSEPPEEQDEVRPDHQPEQEQTPAHARKDPQENEPMSEEVSNPWEPEDQPDEKDDIVEQVSCSSIFASNPWILYEAGIVCSRDEDGHVEMNSSGEKIIVLREWEKLLGHQKVSLKRQSIGRADWEELPWTGHLCYLFTRSWEMGRVRADHHKEQHYGAVSNLLDECRYSGTDWMRGQDEPEGWEDRLSFDRDQWPEIWHLYERDLMIQDDMEWLVEAAFAFYRKHLDKLTRENDRFWGDFCKKVVDDQGRELDQLELNTSDYDMTHTNVEVPKNKKTVIPNPEKHFSFSTKMMVLAIDLHQQEAPREFSSYTVYAHRELVQFFENRKDLTAQSYRFFVEHAYNQFFQHEAFHQSTSSRTKARDLHAGEFHTSTRLDGYIWVANTSKISHVPNDQADDVDMEENDAGFTFSASGS